MTTETAKFLVYASLAMMLESARAGVINSHKQSKTDYFRVDELESINPDSPVSRYNTNTTVMSTSPPGKSIWVCVNTTAEEYNQETTKLIEDIVNHRGVAAKYEILKKIKMLNKIRPYIKVVDDVSDPIQGENCTQYFERRETVNIRFEVTIPRLDIGKAYTCPCFRKYDRLRTDKYRPIFNYMSPVGGLKNEVLSWCSKPDSEKAYVYPTPKLCTFCEVCEEKKDNLVFPSRLVRTLEVKNETLLGWHELSGLGKSYLKDGVIIFDTSRVIHRPVYVSLTCVTFTNDAVGEYHFSISEDGGMYRIPDPCESTTVSWIVRDSVGVEMAGLSSRATYITECYDHKGLEVSFHFARMVRCGQGWSVLFSVILLVVGILTLGAVISSLSSVVRSVLAVFWLIWSIVSFPYRKWKTWREGRKLNKMPAEIRT